MNYAVIRKHLQMQPIIIMKRTDFYFYLIAVTMGVILAVAARKK